MKKLHLGCGKNILKGYINVDIDKSGNPDVIDNVITLEKFSDSSVDCIESYHLLEHLTFYEAKRALKRWYALLVEDGLLIVECPNFRRCLELLYHEGNLEEALGVKDKDLIDDQGINLALVGIYGWPPVIDKNPLLQQHKWGWSPSAIMEELKEIGFKEVKVTEHVSQTWRKAYKIRRDMRVVGRK